MTNYADAELKKLLKIDDKTLKRFKEIREETISSAKKLSETKKEIIAIGISGSARASDDMAQEESNSEFLLSKCLDELKMLGARTEMIKLREYDIQPCKACYSTTNAQCHYTCSCYAKGTPLEDDMTKILYQKILEADIIIFATPVNNFKISSYMSLFIDRCISLDGSLSPADINDAKNKELNIKHTKFIAMNSDQNIPGSGFLRRFSGKVAGIIVTGHEEGAALAISSLFMTLTQYGMMFPPWNSVYAMSSVKNPTFEDKKMVTSDMYIDEAKYLAANTYNLAKATRSVDKNIWKHNFSTN